MALSQIQIIQSLAEALSWFEKELSWGVKEAELRHLTGRIGELYAAMITRGQMALGTNQRGYDVISADNERISVKTITTSNHVSFKPSTFEHVDRVMVLRLNVDPEEGVSIEALFDKPVEEAQPFLRHGGTGLTYAISASLRPTRPVENLAVTHIAWDGDYEIRQYENGTIHVFLNGVQQAPARPHLRAIAEKHGVDLALDSGVAKNTRHLGAGIIKQLNRSTSDDP